MKKLITIILCLMAITVSAQRRTYGAIRAYTNANIYRSEVKRAQLNYSTHERIRSLNHAANHSVYRSTDYVVGMRPTRSSYIRDSYTVDGSYTSDVSELDSINHEENDSKPTTVVLKEGKIKVNDDVKKETYEYDCKFTISIEDLFKAKRTVDSLERVSIKKAETKRNCHFLDTVIPQKVTIVIEGLTTLNVDVECKLYTRYSYGSAKIYNGGFEALRLKKAAYNVENYTIYIGAIDYLDPFRRFRDYDLGTILKLIELKPMHDHDTPYIL